MQKLLRKNSQKKFIKNQAEISGTKKCEKEEKGGCHMLKEWGCKSARLSLGSKLVILKCLWESD